MLLFFLLTPPEALIESTTTAHTATFMHPPPLHLTVIGCCIQPLTSQLQNCPNSQRLRCPPALHVLSSTAVFQLSSHRLSLLLSAATCASYNFSFLSPQGLNFSSSQSSAPFWSGTISFFSSRHCCFSRRSLGRRSIPHTHSHLQVLLS